MASYNTAEELLNFAKNRLKKFYTPKFYKPAPKTFGAHAEKIREDTGVIAMIDKKTLTEFIG